MSLMRQTKIIQLAALLLMPFAASGGDCIGHIFFYNVEVNGGESDADSDFAYYLYKVKTWLPDRGISFSVHTELPIKAMTCFGTQETVKKNELVSSLGYIFVRPDLERKVVGGVMTDVDIDSAINEFFIEINS